MKFSSYSPNQYMHKLFHHYDDHHKSNMKCKGCASRLSATVLRTQATCSISSLYCCLKCRYALSGKKISLVI